MTSCGPAHEVERILIPSLTDRHGSVELLAQIPDDPGPNPAVLFVHGHQFPERPGAARYAEGGQLRGMAALGYVAAAVSQPGYGGSDGPADYCGPRTQSAIRAALRYLERLPAADEHRLALFGVSRGATASAVVAAGEPNLAGIVLVSGIYDLGEVFPTGLPGLDANILEESGQGEAALTARSALRHAHRIVAPTLLVHGMQDDVAPQVLASALVDRLRENEVQVRDVMLPDQGHGIPWPQIDREAVPFLRQIFDVSWTVGC